MWATPIGYLSSIKKSAFMQQHNVSLSGGTERNNYYASIGFKDQSGIFRYGNDSYKRFNLAFSFDTKLTNWLDVSFVTRMSNIRMMNPIWIMVVAVLKLGIMKYIACILHFPSFCLTVILPVCISIVVIITLLARWLWPDVTRKRLGINGT